MIEYDIPLCPGPTRVPQPVRQAYLQDYASPDQEPEYAELYAKVQGQLQQILATKNRLAIMTGEGMVGLWGALRSCIRPGDRVLAMGLELFCDEAAASSSVTALRVPDSIAWDTLRARLADQGLGVGGSLGPLAGKVFRIGHMGSQARVELVQQGMDVIERVLTTR